MYSSLSLSKTAILRDHIRQNIAILFLSQFPLQVREKSFFSRKFQRYSYLCVALLAFFAFHPTSGYALTEGEQREFIVTAYYSPLPNQSFYSRGNYEAEKRLNGNGTHGANNKPVFTGMIAAPKKYEFGTRIYFEGLGVGIVEDRGGAIVEAGERGQPADRIDIWMGHGESGLVRARNWGVRRVMGTITTDTSKPLLNFLDIDTGKIDLSRFESITYTPSGTLSSGALQMFADLGYTLEGRTIREMIILYQKDHKIITKDTDEGAGNFGPRTRASLSANHAQYIALRNAEFQRIEAEKALLLSEKTAWENNYKSIHNIIASLQSPKRGEQGAHVQELQRILKITGYFKGKDTGVMGGSTILAIKSLQKAHGITVSGSLDDHTREILIGILIEKKV